IMIFLSEEGALLSNQLPHLLAPAEIKGFLYSERKKLLLLFKKDDIGFIDFGKNKAEEFWEKGSLPQWLKIGGKEIKQAFWVNDGAQILYSDQNEVFLTERESFNQPVIYKVTAIKKGTAIDYLD